MAKLRHAKSEDAQAEANEQRKLEQRQTRRFQLTDAEQITNNANRYIDHLHLIYSCV